MTRSPDPMLPLFLDVLREQRYVTFVLADDLGDHCGLLDREHHVVFLDARNSVGVQRATIGHELHHMACPDSPEDQIEAMTAALLVPLTDALTVRAGADLAEVADRLGVDPALVRARLRDTGSQVEAV